MGFDLETTGLDPCSPDAEIVSIGLANEHGCVSIQVRGMGQEARSLLFSWLISRPMVAFNYTFDGAFLAKETGVVVPAHFCAFGAFRQLASEGWPGQTWKLKDAMVNILGWPEKNDMELRKWLVENGRVKRKLPLHLLKKLQE